MGARKKLNAAHAMGVLLVAGLMGGLTGSWGVFVVAAVVLFASAVHAGDIR